MSAIHKISEDLFEDTFSLLALHSSLEDYALVYAVNESLKAGFKRSKKDLEIKQSISFPIFEWRDNVNDSYWTLISNNSLKEEMYTTEKDLFIDVPSFKQHYLLPEYREVDYFLKIEQDDLDGTHEILKKLLAMPKILTAYKIDVQKLKSKSNLIF